MSLPNEQSPRLGPGMRPLPEDTSRLVDEHLRTCQNLGLVLDKFQPWFTESEHGHIEWNKRFKLKEKKKVQGEYRWVDRTASKDEAKGHWLSTSSTPPNNTQWIDPRLHPNQRIDSNLFDAFRTRWERVVGQARPIRSRTRLVIGLGSKGTLEMGLTLHHHYGFPIIPGSALKGLTRTVALLKLAAQWGISAVDYAEFQERKPAKEEQRPTPLTKLDALIETPIAKKDDPERLKALAIALKALQGEPGLEAVKALTAEAVSENPLFTQIQRVFGNLGTAGGVVFFDAIPDAIQESPPTIVTEIMTPHFPQYYQDKAFPHDADSPNPVAYLAVEKETRFLFALAPRTNADQALVDQAWKWLRFGLAEFGIGGKTSSGMGLFGQPQSTSQYEITTQPFPGRTEEPSPEPEDEIPEERDEVDPFADEFMTFFQQRRDDGG